MLRIKTILLFDTVICLYMHIFKFTCVGFGLVILHFEAGKSVSYELNYKTTILYIYYRRGGCLTFKNEERVSNNQVIQ